METHDAHKNRRSQSELERCENDEQCSPGASNQGQTSSADVAALRAHTYIQQQITCLPCKKLLVIDQQHRFRETGNDNAISTQFGNVSIYKNSAQSPFPEQRGGNTTAYVARDQRITLLMLLWSIFSAAAC